MSAQKIRIIFSKTGDLRFISHLDLMRLFQRASRRANLPVTITQGFSPHLKISIARALKLGVESPGEEATFHMSEKIEPQVFQAMMNGALPDGVRVEKVEEFN